MGRACGESNRAERRRTVPDGVHLEHAVLIDEVVKPGVEAVQHVEQLPGLDDGGHFGESYNVREQNRHAVEGLGNDGFSILQPFSHVAWENLLDVMFIVIIR